ncbi:hypothetical protein [Chondrinema litorale]|uniref:hypothetical protein n=1 Tax=Chondrinema litorale TaxID=2994555 RepID=UPI00254290C7|nr:hypothetical protein [Chondrinema litorale]UZR96756.1 hypothetical protein OQ292_23935 [Chondrinema litorale]
MKKMKSYILIICCYSLIGLILSSANCSWGNLKYLGQSPPTSTPKVFAPELISKADESEFGSVFNKDATEFYYGVDVNGKAEIRYTRLEGENWSTPKILLSHDKYSLNDPFLSPDENRMYFISNKALMAAAGWNLKKLMEKLKENVSETFPFILRRIFAKTEFLAS